MSPRGDAHPRVTGCPAVHKSFFTIEEARAFIEDWKLSFVEVFGKAMKEALDQGFRPPDMALGVERVLQKVEIKAEGEGTPDTLLGKLSLKDE